MTRDEFAAIVEQTIAALPEEYACQLVNVVIDIEDEPSRETLRELGMDPRYDTLFGLYEGTPIAERLDAVLPLPDRIVLYYRPLIREFRSPGRLRREIEKTLLHEIGHMLGLSDEDDGME